jgi:hypothetical protein
VGGPPAAVQPDPVAIASLVCGILSLLFVCCCGILVFLLGPAAIGLGIWACNRIQADPGQLSGLGMAYTGIGLGAGGLVLEVILLILSVGINLLPAFLG